MDTSSNSAFLEIQVVVQGPGTVEAELVVAGFFEYLENETLIGGAKGLNDGLKGKVMQYRTDGSFSGAVGESFLFKPEADTIPGQWVLLAGLGKRDGITLDIVRDIGAMAVETANRQGFTNLAFAPEIRDAGVTTLPAGDVAQAAAEGFLRKYRELQQSGQPVSLKTCFMLAGAAHAVNAEAGVKLALELAASSTN